MDSLHTGYYYELSQVKRRGLLRQVSKTICVTPKLELGL